MSPTPPTETRASDGAGDGRTSAAIRLLDRPLSESDLAAGARLASQPMEADGRRTVGLLFFRIGPETLAVPAKSLRRITTFSRPSPIPHRASGLLRGLCNIRGELVLCADLHRLLGLPDRAERDPASADADQRRMIMIGPADASWVFEVDSLIGIERIDPAAMLAPPVTVERALEAFVTGLADIDGVRATVLDADRVLSGFQAGLS